MVSDVEAPNLRATAAAAAVDGWMDGWMRRCFESAQDLPAATQQLVLCSNCLLGAGSRKQVRTVGSDRTGVRACVWCLSAEAAAVDGCIKSGSFDIGDSTQWLPPSGCLLSPTHTEWQLPCRCCDCDCRLPWS